MDCWESRLHLAIHMAPLNLLENTFYVFLQLNSCNSNGINQKTEERGNVKALRQFNHDIKNNIRNWWKIKHLKWFEEQD